MPVGSCISSLARAGSQTCFLTAHLHRLGCHLPSVWASGNRGDGGSSGLFGDEACPAADVVTWNVLPRALSLADYSIFLLCPSVEIQGKKYHSALTLSPLDQSLCKTGKHKWDLCVFSSLFFFFFPLSLPRNVGESQMWIKLPLFCVISGAVAPGVELNVWKDTAMSRLKGREALLMR